MPSSEELYFRGSLRDIPTNTYLPAILRQRLNTDLWDNLMLKQDKKFQNIFKKFEGIRDVFVILGNFVSVDSLTQALKLIRTLWQWKGNFKKAF